MKLDIRHTYPCSAETFWKMYWDDRFDELLQANATVDREILEQTDSGDQLLRRMRFTPHAELPSAIATMAGAKKFIWNQENRWFKSDARVTWKVIPELMTDRIKAEGWFTVKDVAGGCEMHVQGEIAVKVRFIGSKIEGQVMSQVSTGYDRMLEAGKTWISQHGS